MLDSKRRDFIIIGVLLVLSIAAYVEYEKRIAYWDALGVYVMPLGDYEEADVIQLSEEVLSRYPRIEGVLLEVDERGTVVLGYDRKDEMDEFLSLSEDHSIELRGNYTYLALGEKKYRIEMGLYGGTIHTEPVYLNLAILLGCIALMLSIFRIYLHFKSN